MPSGTYVTAEYSCSNDCYLNIDVYPLAEDFGKSEGLCGNYNSDADDDITVTEGSDDSDNDSSDADNSDSDRSGSNSGSNSGTGSGSGSSDSDSSGDDVEEAGQPIEFVKSYM